MSIVEVKECNREIKHVWQIHELKKIFAETNFSFP